MLKSPLFWKMTTLFGAVLLLLIPIMLIRQVIVERADYRSDVEDAIRQSTSGPQTRWAAYRYSCDRALYGTGRG